MANSKKNPTNYDIYQFLGRLDEKVEAVHVQTLKTNGRVTIIENWKRGIEAVDSYKKENPVKTTQEVKEGWTTREKQLVAFLSTALAIITVLVANR